MESTKELVAQGKEYFAQHDFPRAESCLRKALAKHAGYADVYHMLGVIHHADGRFASAVDYFQKALQLNPNYTEATLNLVVLYNDLGQYTEAKKLYGQLRKGAPKPATKPAKKETAAAIEPVLRGKLANMHAEVGDIYRGLGLYEQAADEYRKALELNAAYADIRTKLGMALREAGELNNSLTELKQACKDKPSYHLARVQLGVTLFAAGKTTDAKKEWTSVTAKEPKNELAQMYLKLCGTDGKA